MTENRIIQRPEVVTLSPSEHALYSSGIQRGHCEAIKQIVGQLRNAAVQYRQLVNVALEKIDPAGRKIDLEELGVESVLAGYDAIAEQLEEPAKKACAEAQQHLATAIELRKDRLTLAKRIKGAMLGALGGWRGE